MRNIRISFVFFLIGVLPCFLWAQDQKIELLEKEIKKQGLREAVNAGEKIYKISCLPCHGENGDSETEAAEYLDPKPRAFTLGEYKFRSTPSGSLPTDQNLFRTISIGVSGTSMPAWEKFLSEQERQNLVQYIKTFSTRFEQWPPDEEILIPEEIASTPGTIGQGERIYQIMECWACHGNSGKGDGPSASNLKDDWENPIKAYDFTMGNYKGGSTEQDIYRTFNTGLSGTPMPSYYDTFIFTKEGLSDLSNFESYFSKQEIDGIAAWVDTLITDQEFEALTEEQQEVLLIERRWHLVHYVKSLTDERGWFYKLFKQDTELTK